MTPFRSKDPIGECWLWPRAVIRLSHNRITVPLETDFKRNAFPPANHKKAKREDIAQSRIRQGRSRGQ